MAKKKKINYKELKIDESDLAVTKIGEITNQEKSPIFLFFIFGILFVVAFFLPTITAKIEEYRNPIVEEPIEKPNEGGNQEGEATNLTYYDLSSDLSFSLEDTLQVNHFVVGTNTIAFDIKNIGQSKFYFSKKNYFLELYTEDKTLLERIILNKDSIAKDNSKTFSYEILSTTASNAKKVLFVEKSVLDYPNVTLEEDESGKSSLVCTKSTETITYEFMKEKLVSINDTVNYVKTGDEVSYQQTLYLWQQKVTSYTPIEGASASLIESVNGFTGTAVIDLNKVKASTLNNRYYYEKDVLPKVVKFEMEARGFSCN